MVISYLIAASQLDIAPLFAVFAAILLFSVVVSLLLVKSTPKPSSWLFHLWSGDGQQRPD